VSFKELRISPRVAGVPFPPISAVRGWLAQRTGDGLTLVDLCQAVPNYPPAEELRRHLADVVLDPATARYTPDEGLLTVRESVARWYHRRYGAGPEAEEMCLTIGASQAFWLAMSVLCAEGDEVIVPLPAYFDHPMGLAALGVTARYVPFDESDRGVPSLESVRARISLRTRALLLVSPSNPSGVVIPPARLAEFHELAREYGIALVVDETYNAFLPEDAAPHALFNASDWRDNFVHLGSFGKTFALTGYRAGVLVASSRIIHEALKVQDSMAVCQPHATQLTVGYACDHLDAWSRKQNVGVQLRHDRFLEAFSRAGLPFELVTSGGFFAWVKHPCRTLTGAEVVRRMVDEIHVACLPGESFGPGLERFLRLAIGNLEIDAIPAAIERLSTWTP